jgi:hypothetical protein
MIIVMIQIKTTWIIVKYLKCLTYCSWYNYAYIFFKHHNFINVSTRTIIKTKLVIYFYFDVSRMLKLCDLLTCPCSFHLHDLDYGSYSIWWSKLLLCDYARLIFVEIFTIYVCMMYFCLFNIDYKLESSYFSLLFFTLKVY